MKTLRILSASSLVAGAILYGFILLGTLQTYGEPTSVHFTRGICLVWALFIIAIAGFIVSLVFEFKGDKKKKLEEPKDE